MIEKLTKKKGSALIITLLIMGILMTLALGLSDLVIREVRITNDIVNAGKAFYAAEAGIESALLDLNQTLPGYQREDTMIKGESVIGNDTYEIDEDLSYIYKIANLTKAIPFVDTEIIDINIARDDLQKYQFNVLDLNENISIPLFIENEEGRIENIDDFRVEYFLDAEIAPEWKQNVTNQVIDMLRWKITGINNYYDQDSTQCNLYIDPNPGSLTTETIGDYLPALEGTTEELPSCFGTTSESFLDDESGINYGSNCAFMWEYAREAFVFGYVDGEIQTQKYEYEDGLPMTIKEFLNCHDTNYLTLTNLVNPKILFGLTDFEQRNNAKLYYRVLFPKNKAAREFAKVVSTGTNGNSRKQIEAFIKPDSFMPVFNFSLYRTDVSDFNDKQDPTGYVGVSE